MKNYDFKKHPEFNACPVCGKPRGPHDLSHGKCMESRAKTEGKELVFPESEMFGKITREHFENSRRNSVKKRYIAGKLPKWMLS